MEWTASVRRWHETDERNSRGQAQGQVTAWAVENRTAPDKEQYGSLITSAEEGMFWVAYVHLYERSLRTDFDEIL